jgi:hypothetical protein
MHICHAEIAATLDSRTSHKSKPLTVSNMDRNASGDGESNQVPSLALRTYAEQPFYVVDDESYDRMMSSLLAGESTVKSYLGTCPHKQQGDCTCLYFINYLHADGSVVRNVEGVVKPVIKKSNFLALMRMRSKVILNRSYGKYTQPHK